MPRHPTAIGAWGKITRAQLSPRQWRARAQFRDFTGHSRAVEAQGGTGAEAQRNLEARLRDLVAAGGEEIRPDMKLAVLGRMWLEECGQSDLAPQTLDRYRHTFTKHVLPGVGELRVREATVGAMDRFLKAIAAQSAANAKVCKVVLSGMLGLAARHDALRSNPIRDVAQQRRQKSTVRALSVEDVHALRRGIRLWVDAPEQIGQRRNADIPDIVDILLATGARIGELCALRWSDIDLSADRPTLTIAGTVVTAKGQGITRQSHPKSASGFRTVTLPRFAVDALMRRRVDSAPNPLDLLFPSSTGTLRSPANVRRQWRSARDAAGYSWVVPHSFRKTVATLIDAEHSMGAASKVLGHSSSAITEAHYVQRARIAPDVSETLDLFVPNPARSHHE